MKQFIITLGIFIAFACGVYAGYLLFYDPPTTPEIVEVTQYRTEYVKIANTCQEYEKCYRSPIKINPTMNGYLMHIEAGDECKATSADVKVECKAKPDWKGRGVAFGLGALLMLLVL